MTVGEGVGIDVDVEVNMVVVVGAAVLSTIIPAPEPV